MLSDLLCYRRPSIIQDCMKCAIVIQAYTDKKTKTSTVEAMTSKRMGLSSVHVSVSNHQFLSRDLRCDSARHLRHVSSYLHVCIYIIKAGEVAGRTAVSKSVKYFTITCTDAFVAVALDTGGARYKVHVRVGNPDN